MVFLPVLKNDFVDLDRKSLVENLGSFRIGWNELRWMFAAFHFGQYQPLAWLTLGTDQTLWWADPFGYHWTNLILHTTNSALVYLISLELLSYPLLFRYSPQWRGAAAALVAVSFAMHPLRVESVAWASARGELVASAFIFASLLSYLKANSPIVSARDSAPWAKISIGAHVLSLLASPTGLLMPVVLLIFDAYPLRRLTPGSHNRLGNEGWRLAREKWPYFISSSICVGFTLLARNSQPVGQAAYSSEILDSFLHQLAAPAFYLWKTILPIGLSPAYELRGWSLATYIVISAILSGGIAIGYKRWPALASVWAYYLVFAWPVFRSEFPARQLLADRYTYLACCSLMLLSSIAICEWVCIGARRLVWWVSVFASGVGGAIFVGLVILSWNQVQVWHDSETLWRAAVKVNPTSQAYFHLAGISETQEKYDDAIASYKQVVILDAKHAEALEKAARLLEKQGRIKEAVEYYREYIELNPKDVGARESLAGGLVNQGEIDKAVQQFRELLELAPERNEARVKFGTVLAVSGRLDEAAEVLSAAVKANPNDSKVLLKLGQVLAAQGRLNEAVNYFRKAVGLQSEDAEAQESLGRGLLELGEKDEASAHLREAVRILRSRPAAR